MNKIYVIGIGFRPLDRQAREALLTSDAILANSRLFDVFRNNYEEYAMVKEKIIIHESVYETINYIDRHYSEKRLSLLAAGDPMFFGIGRLVVDKFGKDSVVIYPDLSSIQVAFSRIKEPSNNALLISMHGGPDPEKRRKLEYEIKDIPEILERHAKIAILTDRINNPTEIAKVLLKVKDLSQIRIYVCEKLGYQDEKIIEGDPRTISKMSFEHPNVMIIIKNHC